MEYKKEIGIIIFFKRFIIMFVLLNITNLVIFVIWDVLVQGRMFDISKAFRVSTSLGFSLGWGIINIRKYRNCIRPLGHSLGKEELINKIEQVLSLMGWKLKDKKEDSITFQSTFSRTIWIETIVVKLCTEEVCIIGPECYVDKVISKIGFVIV